MSQASVHGRITAGISAARAASRTLDFIAQHLGPWRDDPERPRSAVRERDLNSQLVKFLNAAARQSDFTMVNFHHEEPQGRTHSSDVSATIVDSSRILGRPFTKYEPIVVLECKRLPTPGSGRQREYVTSDSGQRPAGGIQRFKLGLHGSDQTLAGMIGYVQARKCRDWFAEINAWVTDLAQSADPLWSPDDMLQNLRTGPALGVTVCESVHARNGGASSPIRLRHLWVELTSPHRSRV